jgi:hypothetical protein
MKKILLLSLIFLMTFSSAYKVYELHLVIHKNESVDLLGYQIIDGEISAFPSAGQDNYEFRIISNNGSNLFNKSFQMDFTAYRFRGPNSTVPDVVQLTQIEDYWKLPYFEDGKKIQLYHSGKKIFEYEVEEEKTEDGLCALSMIIFVSLFLAIINVRGVRK